MLKFRNFKTEVNSQFTEMAKGNLFTTNVNKDKMWDTYLDSFPEGTNPIFRERTEHDCQCCKQFIRACGNVVSIIDNKIVSIWDIQIGGHYNVVAKAMSKLVKSHKIKDVFIHYQRGLGVDHNHQLLEDTTMIKWEHFHFKLPKRFVKPKDSIGTRLSNMRSNAEIFSRSLEEISSEAAEIVLELIEQNSIYRGKEHKSVVELLVRHKIIYDKLKTKKAKTLYCWEVSILLGAQSKIKNTVIGTLLIDISNGKTLDDAVRMFESKVAPMNYKRPTALITQSMIKKAQNKVVELGIENSLQRRYAVTEDITINNVLFANRTAKKTMNVFDELVTKTPDKIKNLDKIDEITIDAFIKDILPKAENIELLVNNQHTNNFMSLIAPMHVNAEPIFKWGNNFSWAYNGDVTDSIKERVKKAGGNVNGVLRCSLSWFNYDDLDIHVHEPAGGQHIYYGTKRSHTSGILDVDMNVSGRGSRNAVENIVWTNKNKMKTGIYKVVINNFTPRETIDVGLDVEIEFNGVIHTFHYNKRVKKDVTVAKFIFSKVKETIEFIESIPSTQASKEVWGVTTQKFQKVSMIMNSPNHWDGNKTGNKHYFFILENCKNIEKGRGFFNEFLKNDLMEHRKVFEVLGSKMKVEPSDNQLSGLGFSSTQKNQIVCKLTGSFSRILKINF